MILTFYDSNGPMPVDLMTKTAGFLHEHLDRFGDPERDIRKAMEHAMRGGSLAGGFVGVASEDEEIVGAVVVNRTGMKDYIPENILVYVAVHSDRRGKGFGKELMEAAIARAEGGIALHVEPDNPALHLYERLGFTNKYLEMRLCRKETS